MTDDRSRGVHLSDKQLVFVFMAATVAAVVVFLFGVLVGRGVRVARAPEAETTMITPPQAVADSTNAGAPVADGAPPGDAGVGAAGLKFSERLGKEPPPEQLKTPAPAPAVSEAPPDVAEADADVAPGTGDFTVQVAAVKKRAEADLIVRSLKAKGYDAYVFVPGGADKVGGFRVRVGVFRTRREADNLARKIEREEKIKPWVTRI